VAAQAEDRLVIKDGSNNVTFSVSDAGTPLTVDRYRGQANGPGFWLDETGSGGGKGALFVLDNRTMQVQRRGAGFGGFEASVMLFELDGPNAAFTIKSNGYLGLGGWASYPIHDTNTNARLTTGGVWVDASSRELKENITELTTSEAMDALEELKPVRYNYKVDAEEKHVGFIAEDVPELVASKDRKAMSSMDVVAVLTKVVKEQQETIANLSKRIEELENK
jgi:hypothetical protein